MITCRIIFLVICLFLFSFLNIINCSKNNQRYKKNNMNNDIFNDTPKKTDLMQYLEIMERVSTFYAKNINEVDINVYFGLFLSNVNLKRALKNEKIWHIAMSARNLFNEIIHVNEKLITFFLDKTKKDYKPENRLDKMLLRLFTNETEWLHAIEHFKKSNTIKKYGTGEINYMLLSDWNRYVRKVYDVDAGVPGPVQSDTCLASLAGNPSNYGYMNTLCNVDEYCYKMIKNGTDFGYALTHRLLFLLFAEYGRSCSIFSTQEDRLISQRFCSICYVEAEYIAAHNFGLNDLILESMCLCALNGHFQFLRQTWLKQIAHFQTTAGCFGQTMYNVNVPGKHKPRPWKLNRGEDQDILSGHCNGHVTALASATYSFAVRFILEIVY